MQNNTWKLKDVVLLALLSFLFGGILILTSNLWAVLELSLGSIGYAPFANEILFGFWTMPAPVIGMILRKKGSFVLGEVFSALAEFLYGVFLGPEVIISGVLQGLGSEVGFIVTKYQRFDTLPLIYGAIGTTVFSFVYEFFKFGYSSYGLGLVIVLFVVRFISVLLTNVVLVNAILNLYHRMRLQGK